MRSVDVTFDERGEIIEYTLAPGRDADARLWRAISPFCRCLLLRGEAVPIDRLDAEWVARFGRRAA